MIDITKQKLWLEAKHLVVRPNIQKDILNCDIIGVGTLYDKFLDLSHSRMTEYGTGDG